MKLNRIELKGFLSHYGCRNEIGKIDPVVIDFSASPLWLIHGPNGSGKSSLFDAITFALYKRHRGSGSKSGNTFHHLVHDAAENNTAEISLEIEHGEQRYLIQRTITRKKRSGSEVWGIVRIWTDSDWKAVPGYENNIEKWVDDNLRISPETFVSAVVLRQGEADAFLKAKPKDRKDCLLELLDLELYRKLGEAAKTKCNHWKGNLERITKELGEPVAEDSLEAQQRKTVEAEAALTHSQQSQYAKEKELQNATNAQIWKINIKADRERQEALSALLARAEEIKVNSYRHLELTKILPLFDSLWAARHVLEAEKQRIETSQEEIGLYRKKLADFTVCIQEKQEREKAIRQQVSNLSKQLERLEDDQASLAEQLESVKKIEILEAKIQEAEAELEPYLLILSESIQIERDITRHAELTRAILQIQKLIDEEAKLEHERQSLDEKQQRILRLQEELRLNEAEESRLLEALKSKRAEYKELQKRQDKFEIEIDKLAEKLEHRGSINHEDECPICGSYLNTQETQERLAQEKVRWELELSVLEAEKQTLELELQNRKQVGCTTSDNYKIAQQKTRESDKELHAAQETLKLLENSLNRQRKSLDILRQEAGLWVNQINQLATLQIELESLSQTSDRQKQLKIARDVQIETKSKIGVYQAELANLPKFSVEERRIIRDNMKEIKEAILPLKQQQQGLNQEFEDITSEQTTLESEKQQVQTDLRVAERNLDDLQFRRQQAEQALEKQMQAIPSPWNIHAAFEDKAVLEDLQQERDDLSQVEEEVKQLHEAEKQKHQIEGSISVLEKQLASIPIAHRRSVEEVQAELDLISVTVHQAELDLQKERDQLTELNRQKQIYEEKLVERNQAAEEYRYYEKLAKALGSKGLQAKVVQDAQARIKNYANTTLGRLSNNTWQIDLQETKDGKELEILARDLSSPGLPVRQFEYLSGGEKFRVAISLAIAIGQATSGGRTVDTLVIDEGFGALDEVNRGLLVSELRRLSEEVLQGGRVIIVSHQEDICEEFAHRYRISKDSSGYGQVEFNPVNV